METTVLFLLVYPYNRSHDLLRELANIWGLKILEGSPIRRVAKVSIPKDTFKRMFNQTPRKGVLAVPEEMNYFISGIEIVGV